MLTTNLLFSAPQGHASVLLRRAEGDDEVGTLRVAGVADVVMVASSDEADVTRVHLASDSIDGEFAVAFLHEPELVMLVGVIGFMKRAGFLDGFVALELDVPAVSMPRR